MKTTVMIAGYVVVTLFVIAVIVAWSGGAGMRVNEMVVELTAKLDVSKSTAEGCLKLVEIYMNNHTEECIVVVRHEDGTETYDIRPKG